MESSSEWTYRRRSWILEGFDLPLLYKFPFLPPRKLRWNQFSSLFFLLDFSYWSHDIPSSCSPNILIGEIIGVWGKSGPSFSLPFLSSHAFAHSRQSLDSWESHHKWMLYFFLFGRALFSSFVHRRCCPRCRIYKSWTPTSFPSFPRGFGHWWSANDWNNMKRDQILYF